MLGPLRYQRAVDAVTLRAIARFLAQVGQEECGERKRRMVGVGGGEALEGPRRRRRTIFDAPLPAPLTALTPTQPLAPRFAVFASLISNSPI